MMPLLMISKLRDLALYAVVDVPYTLRDKYPMVFALIDSGDTVKARIYVDSFYNEEGDIVKEYRQLFMLPLEKAATSYYYIDFTYFHLNDGIPMGYFVDIILTDFVITTEKGNEESIPVFPNEFLVEKELGLPDRISRLIDNRKHSLERIGRDVEVISLLYDAGLNNLAADLVEALTRFYMSDYEGAIKFFRKVVEGLRNYVQSNELMGMSKERQEFVRKYLSKAYQLISNFGEHSGTHGFMPEAMLSKDIAVSSCRYIVTYLTKGESKTRGQSWGAES